MTNPLVQDRVFAEPRDAIADFRFGAEVAQVFDDMLSRSVPFYGEIQRMVAELAEDIVQPGSNVSTWAARRAPRC